MAAETRILRPFTGLEQLDHVLEAARLRWGSEDLLPGRRSIPVRRYQQEPVSLSLPDRAPEDLAIGLSAAGVPDEAARLCVVARSSRLRMSDIVLSERVADLQPLTRLADVHSRSPTFRTPFSGTDVLVAIVLDEDLPPRPLQPFRRGTWLARTRFTIVTDSGGDVFTPLPLTDDHRERLGLPKGTLHHFVVERPLDPIGSDQALTIWVDESLLAAIDDRASGAAAQVLQHEIFVDAMRAVIATVAREAHEDVAIQDVEGSLAARLAMMLAGENQPGDASALMLRRMRLQPELVSAAVEHLVPNLLATRLTALGDS